MPSSSGWQRRRSALYYDRTAIFGVRRRSMARYDREHKEATRRRIIDTAGRRFKQDGIDGSGIATLMADAGLTNGAFYVHFASKDDLVAAVVVDQLGRQAESYDKLSAGRAGLVEFAREYLSQS